MTPRRAVLALPLGLAACFGYSSPPAERPAPPLRKLRDAKILALDVNLYKQKGLCPGQEGKLYANANVQWPGESPVARSIGNDVDSLAPASFAVTGPLVHGDANAHLFPDPDVLKSVSTGFEATVVYTPEPRFTFELDFPPEYSCFQGWFDDGAAGDDGSSGDAGTSGDEGQDGQHGGRGGTGARGGDGGRVVAYVTFARTRFYPKLLAVIANDHFFLAPADRPLVFGAAGGQGGAGGNGGDGGAGGDQPTEQRDVTDEDGSTSSVTVGTGRAGNGGDGGDGGAGGAGGNGGEVVVVYDSAFPQLRDLIQTDVSGGSPGAGGAGGSGGSGGETSASKGADTGQQGQSGQTGPDGEEPGRPGRAVVHAGAVAARFADLPGVTRLGDAGAPGDPDAAAQPPAHRRRSRRAR